MICEGYHSKSALEHHVPNDERHDRNVRDAHYSIKIDAELHPEHDTHSTSRFESRCVPVFSKR